MKEKVRVQVLSSFEDAMGDSLPGTLVVDEDEIGDDMERQLITGVAYNRNEAKITLVNVPDRPGAVATIFSPLAEANINRSEEHTSELQSLMRISYAVFCLKKKKKQLTLSTNTTKN